MNVSVLTMAASALVSLLPAGPAATPDATPYSQLPLTALPYPASPRIKSVAWAPKETIVREAQGSDHRPLTWADDDNVYTAYGDGYGFERKVPAKLSLGFARIVALPAARAEGQDAMPAAANPGEMAFPGKDWQEATPESQGVDSARLDAAVRYLESNSGRDGVEELVIIRNGCMIWKGTDIDKVHGVWSLTKSFTSTVLGLLIDDGKTTLDTLAKEVVPTMAAAYPTVTLRHFATMTSGYYALNDEPSGEYKHGPSSTPFTPATTPLFTPPGSKYAYWDSAMNQFANALTRIAGEPIEELFKRRVANPIGMNPAKWNWGDFGEVDGIVVNGGSGNHNNHIFISARELARFGHLFLNRGRWKDNQLISASWVDAATKVQVPVSLPLGHPESGIDGRGVYGLNWWVNGIKANGKRKWPGAPMGTYSASGYNNNDMFIIPEWSMVIVRLGLDQASDGPISDSTYSSFLNKIGQALIEPNVRR